MLHGMICMICDIVQQRVDLTTVDLFLQVSLDRGFVMILPVMGICSKQVGIHFKRSRQELLFAIQLGS